MADELPVLSPRSVLGDNVVAQRRSSTRALPSPDQAAPRHDGEVEPLAASDGPVSLQSSFMEGSFHAELPA
ncbi:MAG: hypothetical protein R5N74_08775 [Cutibacterium granulosum]|nr:hypothetical protein [Cutibacterium granulosum]